jgi:hypothetical protein
MYEFLDFAIATTFIGAFLSGGNWENFRELKMWQSSTSRSFESSLLTHLNT